MSLLYLQEPFFHTSTREDMVQIEVFVIQLIYIFYSSAQTMNTSSEHMQTNQAQPEHGDAGEEGWLLTATMLMRKVERGGVQWGVKGHTLICPTFSDAYQLMHSTVTLATWKDNAVSMSHTLMEGAQDTQTSWKHI